MSFSLFETESGIRFYYDNINNQILEVDGTPVTPGMIVDEATANYANQTFGKTTKHNRPVGIRILLGHACNFSCAYCLQKDIGNPSEIPKNIMLNSTIKTIEKTLVLDDLVRIELWGGEPLLYWKDMVELIKYFDREGLTIGITTNGSALRPKHAELFATLKSHVAISISHDAAMQGMLRGNDPLDNASVVETLRMFDRLDNVHYGFLCSLTNTNFNLFEINDFFRDRILQLGLRTNSISYSLGRTYSESNTFDPSSALGCNVLEDGTQAPAGSATHVIHGENLEIFRGMLFEYLEQHYLQMIDSYVDGRPTIFGKTAAETPLLLCDIYESPIGYSVLEYASKTLNGTPIIETTNCGADMTDVLSIDINGNVRTCVHTGEDHIAGNIKNIDHVNIQRMNLNRESHCGTCVNRKLCRSSCPIDLDDDTHIINCNVEKVWYGELQKAALRLIMNEPVRMISTGLSTINNNKKE